MGSWQQYKFFFKLFFLVLNFTYIFQFKRDLALALFRFLHIFFEEKKPHILYITTPRNSREKFPSLSYYIQYWQILDTTVRRMIKRQQTSTLSSLCSSIISVIPDNRKLVYHIWAKSRSIWPTLGHIWHPWNETHREEQINRNKVFKPR